MKVYNRSLDYITLAMAKGRSGDTAQAAKLFAKAIAAPDALRAIAVLETSNAQAFEATAAFKQRKVQAAEFDLGEDEDVEGLTDEDSEEVVSGMDDDEDEGFDEEFAKVLSSLKRPARR